MHSANAPNKLRMVANFAAYSLIIASTTFGIIYGYNISYNHGKIMAFATVLMVIGLEIMKPLAVSFAFSCFQRFQFVRGLLLSLLAVVAIAYSLTAELALLYGSRTDTVSERKSQSFHASSNQAQFEKANKELQALPKTRATVAEVKSELTQLQAKYPNVDFDCKFIENKQDRLVCPKVGQLNAEIGLIDKREKLQATIDGFLNKAPDKNAEKLADPGSAALQSYLSIFGVNIEQGIIAQFVVLIPVFALEIGSSLGLLLVRAIGDSSNSAVRHLEAPDIQPGPAARRAIMRQLADTDEVKISQRKLAKQEGLDKSTIQRAMHELKQEGVIDLETHKRGTVLRLKKGQQ